MESFLWACNLMAVVFLCFWAIKEDEKDPDEKQKDKNRKQR